MSALTWLRENWFVASLAGAALVLELRKVALARRARRAVVGGGFPEFKYEPRVVCRVSCDCGMGATCEDLGAIVAAGWTAPKTHPACENVPETRWACPACSGSVPRAEP